MARRFTIELIMNLASRIGANPAKAMSRSNISFLGKGPTKNPLFQERLAGLENATQANLGKPETLFGAIEDAVGWAKDGKLNSIQTEILGHNLTGIERILHPPVLPSASITPIASGIEGLRRFPKESHKLEGKIPDARGRTWDLSKARNEKFLKNMGDDLQKSRLQETGPERYNRLTGLDKSKPFQGWTPSVVPKVNIPASKINHQMIADKYGIDVELIEGKDWVEVLEVIRKLGLYAHGGLARILEV
jgi:hypothetical protein